VLEELCAPSRFEGRTCEAADYPVRILGKREVRIRSFRKRRTDPGHAPMIWKNSSENFHAYTESVALFKRINDEDTIARLCNCYPVAPRVHRRGLLRERHAFDTCIKDDQCDRCLSRHTSMKRINCAFRITRGNQSNACARTVNVRTSKKSEKQESLRCGSLVSDKL
jgi:hypothetical protein